MTNREALRAAIDNMNSDGGMIAMGMTDKSLCDSCTNIGCEFQSGIVRTECAFYMPPQLELHIMRYVIIAINVVCGQSKSQLLRMI